MFDSRKIKALLAGFGIFAVGAAIPVAALADDTGTAVPTPVQAQDATFDDATIEAFATAQVRIEEIRSSYLPEFQAAATEAERQQINQQATQEMIAAVESTPDLTLDEFNAVSEAAGEDPALAARIDEAMAESPT